MPDPSYSSLIFPLASQPSPLTSLKRSPLTIHNRLASIVSDAEFVRAASTSSRLRGRPVVANERCGSWYVPPEGKGGSAYFKSTDGHERAWKFSTRRLNLHLVEMIEENDGYVSPQRNFPTSSVDNFNSSLQESKATSCRSHADGLQYYHRRLNTSR